MSKIIWSPTKQQSRNGVAALLGNFVPWFYCGLFALHFGGPSCGRFEAENLKMFPSNHCLRHLDSSSPDLYLPTAPHRGAQSSQENQLLHAIVC
ncbi:hypothetical protein BD410DRAFT_621229 [Rickenella mellea]|uniref:Uncharacterized protein n=1 Tax=Rickenella mellea TaxID=50990 RepID=A0A4Y7PMV3_9AGAM|nr:hypothetical protein BD410DRAFT_621229 [Rickenella mellea]